MQGPSRHRELLLRARLTASLTRLALPDTSRVSLGEGKCDGRVSWSGSPVLDVGKDEVVAAVRTPGEGGKRRQEIRTFPTFTRVLEALADWLAAEGVTEVVMEATGQYWKPVWYVLEERGGFDLMLVNARHVKILPGRKTDVADAAWLAELLEHGLLRAQFRAAAGHPRAARRDPLPQTADPGLTPRRSQRIQKTLEDAGIKLDSVASDVLGVSGRLMLKALIAGERDPEVLAELAKGRLRNKIPELRQALHGRFEDHHALLVRLALEHVEHLEAAIAQLDGRSRRGDGPFRGRP